MDRYFKGFIGYSEEEFKRLWDEALFVLDTNVLLDLYKYSMPKRTQNLLKIFKYLKSKNRLWIPHHVALEYFHNYRENKNKREIEHKIFKEKLNKQRNVFFNLIKEQMEKYRFQNEKINVIKRELNDVVKKSIKAIDEKMEQMIDSDKIEQEILSLLQGIVGDPFTQDEIKLIEVRGKARYSKKIPPGYEDDENKNDFRSYGNITYELKYGDLIIWFQLIEAIKKNRSVPVIFITEDTTGDWWLKRNSGQVIGPHPYLIQEFYNETGFNFYMYSVDSFLKRSKDSLKVSITEDDYKEAFIESKEEKRRRKVDSIAENTGSKAYLKINNREILKQKLLNLKPEKILQFLEDFEEQELLSELEQIIKNQDIDNKGNDYLIFLRNAIIRTADKIEERANFLIKEIALKDAKLGNYYFNQLAKIPKVGLDRGLTLLSMIDEMERDMMYFKLDDLPF